MLFDGLPDVALRLLNGLPVAKATGDVWCIGEVPFILRLLLDNDLKGIELHKLTALTSCYARPCRRVPYPALFLSQSRTAASRMVESGTLRNRVSRSRSASTAADKHQPFTSVFILRHCDALKGTLSNRVLDLGSGEV